MPRCQATARRTGAQCGNNAARGLQVCEWHGAGHIANPPSARVAERRATAILNLDRTIDPAVAMAQELTRTCHYVSWLGNIIAELEPGQLVEENQLGNREPSALNRLFLAERAHLAKVAKMCVDAGIAERTVRVIEEQAQLVADALRGTMQEMQMSPDIQAQLTAGLQRRMLDLREAG